jgi:gluconate:H+ symporter, GntP family
MDTILIWLTQILTWLTHPLAILGIGIVLVVGMILVLRLNAFLALIVAALVVSLLAPGPWGEKVSRVAVAFGLFCGRIGIVIALAAVIGKCMMDSGAADRIVRSFLRLLGEKRAPEALVGASFVLAVPVFFDTVFYLMVPLARSLWRRTGRNYMLYLLAIATGGVITHCMVPPTPGPLLVAANLNVHVGLLILVGAALGVPAAMVGLLGARLLGLWTPVEMRPYAGEAEADPLPDDRLPRLWIALAPILLPVVLISSDTITQTLLKGDYPTIARWVDLEKAAEATALVGNPNFALLLSAALAMSVLKFKRRLRLAELAKTTETALMSGGVIILITAAGGAFGEMLNVAGVGGAVEALFTDGRGTGVVMLLIGFGVASLLKTAQGSSTVAMVTASAMMAAMGASAELLGFHPVYLATAIAGGSLVCSWMNDSGFWVFARMSVLTEAETLRSWTIQVALIGVTILGLTLLASRLVPLTSFG